MTEDAPEPAFESSQKESRRATWALNGLVVLSALAGAVFFGYVLHTVNPWGGREAPPVEIPVSAPGAKVGMLVADKGGLSLTLKDVDEAPTYREELSRVMLRDLGISQTGRLYVLEVRNGGEQSREFAPGLFEVSDGQARKWRVQWLKDVADSGKATGTGALRLEQSAHRFSLAKGESRQLFVFIASGADTPPSAEDLVAGEVQLSGATVKLEHTEVKVAGR